MQKYVVDTNALLDNKEIILEYSCIILSHVFREIEKHISNYDRNPSLAYQARQARNYLLENKECVVFDLKDYNVTFEDWDNDYTDNKIIQACIDNGYGLITYDGMLKLKANAVNDAGLASIEVIELNTNSDDDYKGYLELVSDEDIATYMSWGGRNIKENVFDLLPNQYLIVKNKDSGGHIDILRWTGDRYVNARKNGFKTETFGNFTPRDSFQQIALDSLEVNDITMIKGKAGSGKSKIALEYSWEQIESGEKDKLIIFANPVASRNSAKLGFYKGDRNTKLLDSTVGTMLGAKFGSKKFVEDLISKEDSPIMILPFSDIRGFDTTGMNAIVWIIESQNLDIDLMKLAIQRCGDDTKLIIDGDYNSQVDMEAYSGRNNGMRRVSEVFRGKEFYGEVELPNIYRSKMAKIAELM